MIWTGDSARHDSDEKHPRSADEVLSTNIMMADKFVDTFSSKKRRMDVPVVPTWGNNDFLPHNIFFPGPNKWLRKYSEIWKRFIPEEQRHSFEFGGWFWVEVIPNQLAVFSLNTMYFFDRNAGVDGCADPSEPGFRHMEWLSIQLQIMRDRGMKAILIGHVPPARTDNKQNWDETCWQKYTLWLQQYRDVVTGSLYGHMNIDHFLLQDTKEIDIALESGLNARESLEDEFSITSKQDYLQDLRKGWSDLPGSALNALAEDEEASDVDASGKKKKKHKKKKKKDKYKKIGGKHAERYVLSLVSPSIVPNYFPTLRVIEYNITGLQDSKVWADSFDATKELPSTTGVWDETEEEAFAEMKDDLEAEKKKKKGKKHKKPKKPKDPHLVIPKDPPEGSTPGPAYFPQLMTFTGYTQYFANLTYINNDLTQDVEGEKWRDGDYTDEEPNYKDPRPREFKFEVEYNTFDDKFYKLKDMTVMEYVKLAYRLGKKKVKGKAWGVDEDELEEEESVKDEDQGLELRDEKDLDEDFGDEDFESFDSDSNNDVLAEEKKGKKKKKKHHKNKAWLHFLDRAFVGTVPKEELEKMS